MDSHCRIRQTDRSPRVLPAVSQNQMDWLPRVETDWLARGELALRARFPRCRWPLRRRWFGIWDSGRSCQSPFPERGALDHSWGIEFESAWRTRSKWLRLLVVVGRPIGDSNLAVCRAPIAAGSWRAKTSSLGSRLGKSNRKGSGTARAVRLNCKLTFPHNCRKPEGLRPTARMSKPTALATEERRSLGTRKY